MFDRLSTDWQGRTVIRGQMTRAAEQRQTILDAEANAKNREASYISGGEVEGKNAEERAAKLKAILEGDEEYQEHKEGARQARTDLADAEMQLAIAHEVCRVCRLQLLLMVPGGALEMLA